MKNIVLVDDGAATGATVIAAARWVRRRILLQKGSWWTDELESLGVSPKVRNELNDIQETSNLAENLKHVFYQAYKDAYKDNEDNNKNSSNVQMALV